LTPFKLPVNVGGSIDNSFRYRRGLRSRASAPARRHRHGGQ